MRLLKILTPIIFATQLQLKMIAQSLKKLKPKCYRILITQEERPTFQQILDELKYNIDFTTSQNINEQEFHNFINILDSQLFCENPNIFDPASVFLKK